MQDRFLGGNRPFARPGLRRAIKARFRPWFFLCSSFSFTGFLLVPAAVSADTKTIAIDYSGAIGTIDLVLGANRNPERWLNNVGLVDMTTQLRDVGIVSLRTHGIDEDHSHPTNLEGVFPDWRQAWWDGDEQPYLDPANHNFDNAAHSTPLPGTYTYVYAHSTDGKIANILENGFSPFFRLGYRPNADNKWDRFAYLGYDYMPNPIPDTDIAREKVAVVCENIVRHYREGWNGGHEYEIEFWEVWNEPDIKGMWGNDLTNEEYDARIADGSLARQFQKMYAAIARRIRGTRSAPLRPGVKIGPCALAWTVYPMEYHRLKSRGFCEDLLRECDMNDVPVDFYSWHHYGGLQAQTSAAQFTVFFAGNAWVILEGAQRVREALEANHYPDALSVCDEWNSLVNQSNPYHDTDLAAAFTACALIYMDYADVAVAHYFPMARVWGLFDENADYTREAYAFRAFARLRADTPLRLPIDEGLVLDLDEPDADNFGVMAGKSRDGGLIQVLLADEDQKYIKAPGATHWLRSSGAYFASNAVEDPSRRHYDEIVVELKHLPAGGTCDVTRFSIDSNGEWAESPSESYRPAGPDSSISLRYAWQPPAVCLLRIDLERAVEPARDDLETR